MIGHLFKDTIVIKGKLFSIKTNLNTPQKKNLAKEVTKITVRSMGN
jgi:phenylpyruvate tautomerase PptA (4-oxalocrotonate tautomerase family)